MAERSALREVVGAFTDALVLERAIQELLTAGFDQADISVLASEQTVHGALGSRYRDTRQAEDDPAAPRQVWATPEARTEGRAAVAGILGYLGAVTAGVLSIATGGAAAVAIAAGVAGGGATAALGASLAKLADTRLADQLQTQIDHGGIVLWVRVDDDGQEREALDILRTHGARDLHPHLLPSPP